MSAEFWPRAEFTAQTLRLQVLFNDKPRDFFGAGLDERSTRLLEKNLQQPTARWRRLRNARRMPR